MNFKTEFANVVSFSISCLTICNLLNMWCFGDNSYLTLNVLTVLFQCSYDIFLYHSNDSVIHHCFVLMIGYLLTFDLSKEEFQIITVPLLITEISTFFMILRLWMINLDIKGTVYAVNNALFAGTFFATRIYYFYFSFLVNAKVYEIINSHVVQYFDRMIVYGGLFGFTALNYYWFILILKIGKFFGKDGKRSTYNMRFITYVSHYYTLIFYYWKEDLKVVTNMFFLPASCFIAVYSCIMGSGIYLNESFYEIYDSNLPVLPVLIDVILEVFASSFVEDLQKVVILVLLAWVMFLVYIMKPFYTWNHTFLWMLFLTETIFLHHS